MAPTRRRLLLAFSAAALLVLGAGVWRHLRPEPLPPRPARREAVSLPPGSRVVPSPLRTVQDDEPPGLLALEGFVVDQSDRPVPEALVQVEARPARRTTTDRQGYFAFSGLAGRTYEVVARRGDSTAGPLRLTVSPDSAPVLLRLGAGARLQVLVLDATTDRPLAGARVEVQTFALAETTDSSGVAVLRGLATGRFTVRAAAPGYAPLRKEVFPSAGGAVDRSTLALLPGALLAGTVVDPSGGRVAGATVELERASGALLFAPEPESVRTSERGEFRFEAVARGTFRLRASHSDWAPVVTAPFDADGATPQPRHWLQLGDGVSLRGRVLTRTGAAAPFAEVSAVFDQAPSLRAGRRTLCDARGAFELRGLPRVAVALVASDGAAVSKTRVVELARGPAPETTLVLEEDGIIEGVVVGSDGAPRPEVVVRLADDPSILALPRDLPAGLTGPDGRFALRGLAPGRHVLQAVAPGSPYPKLDSRQVRGSRLEVETGTLDARLVLAEGAVRGRVAFEDGTLPARFAVQLEDDVADRQAFGSGGSFLLERVPAGDHGLRVQGPDFAEARALARVPEGGIGEVGTVVVARGRTLRGEVRDGQGPVPGARVISARELGGELDLALGSAVPYEDGKETLTDSQGTFVLSGLEKGVRVVVAEHPVRGSSPHVEVFPGQGPIVLELQPTGSISGRLTRGGRPLQGAVTAVRESEAGTLSRAFVTSEADGSYRLDRLPPGEYVVGWGGAYRLELLTIVFEQDERTTRVALGPGEQRTLDLEIPVQPVLQVHGLVGGQPAATFVYLAPRGTRAARAEELEALGKTVRSVSSEWWSALSDELPPHTAVLPAVEPGEHVLCVRRAGPPVGPVACRSVEVSARPDVQRVTVELPAGE